MRVAIHAGSRPFDIEVAWVGVADPAAPLLVFLHEGLGSVAMWKDFPGRLCQACGLRGLVYSRPGYGRSTPRPADEHWGLDFMHIQAQQVLPALLRALGVQGRYSLFGHSDSGSIALLHAAHAPERVSAVTVMSTSVSAPAAVLARNQYASGALRQGLAKYHDDVDSAFWGWNDIWLAPEFPQWQITSELKHIRAPVLAIQGVDDPYGTMAQIDGIASAVGNTRLIKLAACGHSPHRDQPEQVIQAVQAFIPQTAPQEAPQETTSP